MFIHLFLFVHSNIAYIHTHTHTHTLYKRQKLSARTNPCIFHRINQTILTRYTCPSRVILFIFYSIFFIAHKANQSILISLSSVPFKETIQYNMKDQHDDSGDDLFGCYTYDSDDADVEEQKPAGTTRTTKAAPPPAAAKVAYDDSNHDDDDDNTEANTTTTIQQDHNTTEQLYPSTTTTPPSCKKQGLSFPRRGSRILWYCVGVVFVLLLIIVLVVTLRDKDKSSDDEMKNNPNLQIQDWQQVGASMEGTLSDFLGISLAMSASGQIVAAGAPHAAASSSSSSSSSQQRSVGQVVAMQWYNSSQEWRPMTKSSTSDDAAASTVLTGSSLNDYFGSALALSANGWTLAAGAIGGDSSGGEGDDNDDDDDDDDDVGYVRVFDWNNATQTWQQVGQNLMGMKTKDGFGNAVALSTVGDVLAVGATSSNDKQGYVQVYHRTDTSTKGMWTAMGQDLIGKSAGDEYGKAIALSEDGRRLAVGASQQQTTRIGLVQIFEYDDTADQWSQVGHDLVGYDKDHWFGETLDLSAEGNILAVGERGGSGSTGHVRVFGWNETSTAWDPMGQTLKGERRNDNFGCSVALSSDGETLVVGGNGNDGEGDGAVSIESAGHVRVFAWDRKKLIWQQVGPDMDGETSLESFGSTVAMSADGTMLAAGGPMKYGFSGHVRIFRAIF